MKSKQQVVHIHAAEKMTCSELASALSEARSNVKRYSELKESSSAVQKAAEEHFIALLKAQIERAK